MIPHVHHVKKQSVPDLINAAMHFYLVLARAAEQ